MKNKLRLWVFIFVGSLSFFALGTEKHTPISVASGQYPKIKWNERNVLEHDLNSDGTADFAILGNGANAEVSVCLLLGPLKADAKCQLLSFKVGKGTQDSLCTADIEFSIFEKEGKTNFSHLPVEKWGCDRGALDERCRQLVAMKLNISVEDLLNPKKETLVKLADKECDAFWIGWDSKSRKFTWTRN